MKQKMREKPRYKLHHNKKLFYWIIFLIIVLIAILIYIKVLEKESPGNGGAECSVDSDCFPGECCHPTSCVSEIEKPDCSGIGCTEECRGDTLDCGQGTCQCQEGKCTAVIDNPLTG